MNTIEVVAIPNFGHDLFFPMWDLLDRLWLNN